MGEHEDEIRQAFALTGRLAVVTGAASGIGKATAELFGAAGARLVLADNDGARLDEVVRSIGGETVAAVVDVTDRAQVDALARRARAIAPIDVWANVAGVITTPTAVVDVDEATLDRLLAVNLKGTYWGCAAAARAMSTDGHGSIINISSAGADVPSPGLSGYSLTKAAVNMLTRTLAVEVGPSGVRVNAVAPGFIDTPMVTYRFTNDDGSTDEAAKAAIFGLRAAASPLGRIGETRDIAMALLFLASDASRFMTGEVMRVNGGIAMMG